MHPALMAERYLYIPSVGFCIAVGVLFSRLVHAKERSRSPSRVINLIGTVVLIILFVFTLRRNHAWENQHEFTVNMVKDAAGTEFAHYFLGTLYKEDGRADDAIRELTKALALNPNLPEAHYSMGILYVGKELLGEAEKEFQQTLALTSRNVKAYNNLGVVYAMQGKMNEAVIQFEKALHLDPYDVFARENLEKASLSIR
jgi:tetratricopeptide (TPR) repeat protein